MKLEENLKTIKDAKLDIELIRRESAKMCQNNDLKIGELNVTIGVTEKLLEVELKESGEKKLECKLGYCAYRVMPDKWEYNDTIILDWAKKKGLSFHHTIEVLERNNLKEVIKSGTLKIEEVSGLTITPQAPKFNYKLKGGL